jgi:hypothetical protein
MPEIMTEGVLNTPTTAQDLAKSQGSTQYEELADSVESGSNSTSSDYASYDSAGTKASVASDATVKPATSYMDTAKSTVAGQLSSLLSSDSPYIKQAENKAKEESQSRGLLNSTLAAQAGRTAAIQQALPIAQQDASEYNKFSLQQQSADNEQSKSQAEGIISANLVKQKAAVAQKQQDIQNAFTARMASADETSKVELKTISDSHEVLMNSLTAEQNKYLQSQEISAKVAESIRTQSSAVMQNYQISVENLLTDPDFLNLGAEAFNTAINNLQTLASNSIKFIGVSSGLDSTTFGPFVDQYLKPTTYSNVAK